MGFVDQSEAMSSCFLSYISGCSHSRGICDLSRLLDCNDSIESHMRSVHLTSENINEHELIQARAGYFDLSLPKVSDLWICPKHRHTLGKFWKQRRPCQYPLHKGASKAVKGRDVVNLITSKDILRLYKVLVPVGSGWYKKVTVCFYFFLASSLTKPQ